MKSRRPDSIRPYMTSSRIGSARPNSTMACAGLLTRRRVCGLGADRVLALMGITIGTRGYLGNKPLTSVGTNMIRKALSTKDGA